MGLCTYVTSNAARQRRGIFTPNAFDDARNVSNSNVGRAPSLTLLGGGHSRPSSWLRIGILPLHWASRHSIPLFTPAASLSFVL